jgi:hypothetical protein
VTTDVFRNDKSAAPEHRRGSSGLVSDKHENDNAELKATLAR